MSQNWEAEYGDHDATLLERTVVTWAAIGLAFGLGYVTARETLPLPARCAVPRCDENRP